MNINRFKHLLILFLAVLNAGMLVLNVMERNKYVLTGKRESAIISLLSSNNIGLYGVIERNFSPKYNLAVSPVVFRHDDILPLFMPDGETPESTQEFNQTVYTSGNKSVYFDMNLVTFVYMPSAVTGEADDVFSDSDIPLTCGKYVGLISKFCKDSSFKEERSYKTDVGTVVEYRSVYDGYVVYSNFIRFTFGWDGSFEVSFSYSEVNGYIGEKKEIYSSDEVLLMLMYNLKNVFGDTPVMISSIDVVYVLPSSAGRSGEQSATPCYRVYTKEQISPFLIDAYFNAIL